MDKGGTASLTKKFSESERDAPNPSLYETSTLQRISDETSSGLTLIDVPLLDDKSKA